MDKIVVKTGKSTVDFDIKIESARTKENFVKIWGESPIFKSMKGRDKYLSGLYAKIKKAVKKDEPTN